METDNQQQPAQPAQPSRPKHIPRSPNAFMFYSQRQRINSRQLGMNQQMLSTIIGKKWHNLSESQKNHYKEMADKAKSEHKIKYPNYKYIPKSKKKSKSNPMSKPSNTTTYSIFNNSDNSDNSWLENIDIDNIFESITIPESHYYESEELPLTDFELSELQYEHNAFLEKITLDEI
jgi:hypothetical protein